MTERQGVGILYNIPHLAESFITHCLLYRFTHRAPRKMPPTPKSSTFLQFRFSRLFVAKPLFFLILLYQLSNPNSKYCRQSLIFFTALYTSTIYGFVLSYGSAPRCKIKYPSTVNGLHISNPRKTLRSSGLALDLFT